MIPISVDKMAEVVGGKLLQTGKLENISQVSTDTRTMRPGDFFACLVGDNFDGHHFTQLALLKGACGLLVQRPVVPPAPSYVHVVQVADTKKALMKLARYQRDQFNGPVIGITGSQGKTSTKEWLRWLISGSHCVLANDKNFNNELGVTFTWLGLHEAHEVAVIEMGMRGIGQIRELCEISKPKYGLITGIGTAHLGELKSLKNIARTKLELFDELPSDGLAFFPNGMGYQDLARLTGQSPKRVVGHDNWVIKNVVLQEKGNTAFTLLVAGQEYNCKIPLWGIGQIQNAVLALALCVELGHSLLELLPRLALFPGLSERLELKEIGTHKVLNDAYNASPESMKEALAIAGKLNWFKKKRLVLGDMLELGEESDEFHLALLEQIQEAGPEKVYLIGPAMKKVEEALAKNEIPFSVEHFETIDEVANSLLIDLKDSEGDLILIKSSHGIGLYGLPKLLEEGLT